MTRLDMHASQVFEMTMDRALLMSINGQGAVALQRPGIRPWRRGYYIAKRVLDITVCLLLLPIVLPILALCGALIWIESPGPIMFSRMRTGRGGHPFRMFKLRTMVVNAEELKAKYAHLNEHTWPDFKITNDPRVTRVGRFLRKTSLDELPQIFNVLLGDMSLVGPRPTSFDVSTYSLWHTERLEVLPGITGLWQISGRAEVDFDERIRLDVEYIEKQSMWLDLKILFYTALVVFRSRGAY
jgi:lipopolysaccharide/colanic/teichoic acid biosynthesis glycosyltransferase